MKHLIFIISLFFFLPTEGQQDTIVVTDYTKLMVGTNQGGEVFPVTSLEEVKHAGFFINGIPEGILRICSSEDLFIWANGKLIDVIDECHYYKPQEFFHEVDTDTIYISFSTESSLAELKCELVIFEDLLVIRDQVFQHREIRNEFKEFIIIALLILLVFIGIIISSFPSRVSYLLEKSFTLKASAYEFVNTGFFTGASMYLLSFYSLALAFTGIYLDSLLSYGLFGVHDSLSEFILSWLQVAFGIFILFILKWLVISVVAGLFKFRGLKNYQLFDFLNFNLVLLMPILILLILDFVLNHSSQSLVASGHMIVFPLMLILFVIWFTLKFVNNSPRKKLSIISYLCATEIIPVIILLGWFFK